MTRATALCCQHTTWTSVRFQKYLQHRGCGAAWGSVIYPSMKKAVAHVMKVEQDHVEPHKNSFELYGADFVLGRDFRPWLIEINSSPTMHPSMPVTAQLCAKVQEDTIKVAVDRSGDIGNFQLLFGQASLARPCPGGGCHPLGGLAAAPCGRFATWLLGKGGTAGRQPQRVHGGCRSCSPHPALTDVGGGGSMLAASRPTVLLLRFGLQCLPLRGSFGGLLLPLGPSLGVFTPELGGGQCPTNLSCTDSTIQHPQPVPSPQPVVELPPFSRSDLCVAGISVRRARRQVLPVCNFKASASLWDAQPLKAQCPLAMPDPTQGPTRPALQRDLGLKDEKGLPRPCWHP
ncbi:hypothetical protein P7K49_003296 [Saguinus oedipus]|uniref:Uncharacterized protein n=1 Tax=Saguinus oedipus TaxID=9490 RepID=A0ABQ9WJR7_SAGOE|nr:hypothetical protein P7K49_003296 [Saguinus oedipus]